MSKRALFFTRHMLVAISLSLFLLPTRLEAVEILNLRQWTAPDHTRIVLDTDAVPLYTVRSSKNKLVLTLKNGSLDKNIPSSVIINQPGIKKIAFLHTKEKDLRIEFFLDAHQKYNVFSLKKFRDKPDRIVVDILLKSIQPTGKKQKLSRPDLKKIIVIDPGHGGEDPGAIGKRGSLEKNIVLAISREIKNTINKKPGFRAVLTRDGDYYVSFKKRLQKAKEMNASLFISIHADAARNRYARGSSVYCLSTGAASSEAAKLLAHHENLSDIFGGDTDFESHEESLPIIMNMFQTNTINLSKIYAEMLIKYLNQINCVKYEVVQEAPFRVLKLPDIPAVLVETAYLSNTEEEKLLKKKDFHKKIAAAISSSLEDYFRKTSPPTETTEAIEYPTQKYKIKKGDTLFSVAKRFHTCVPTLTKLNNLQPDDVIFVGQEIIVPRNPH